MLHFYACVAFRCPQKPYSLTHPSPRCSGGDKLCFIAASPVGGFLCTRLFWPHLDTHWHDGPKPASDVLIYSKMCRVMGGEGSENILVFMSLAGGFPTELGEL